MIFQKSIQQKNTEILLGQTGELSIYRRTKRNDTKTEKIVEENFFQRLEEEVCEKKAAITAVRRTYSPASFRKRDFQMEDAKRESVEAVAIAEENRPSG